MIQQWLTYSARGSNGAFPAAPLPIEISSNIGGIEDDADGKAGSGKRLLMAFR